MSKIRDVIEAANLLIGYCGSVESLLRQMDSRQSFNATKAWGNGLFAAMERLATAVDATRTDLTDEAPHGF